MTEHHSQIRIGIDTGGTFTDIVAADEGSGAVVTIKTPSTPHDPSIGFMDGLTKVLDVMGAEARSVSAVSHGTTVATNALLQEDFPNLGFVTTEGFRHVLEIARQSVPEGYGNSYFWVKPERIVPLHLVREIPGRIDASGAVVTELDPDAAREAARWFKEREIDAVGVCFINAYVNPEHEEQVRQVFAAEYPECAVSISSDVLREYREYERSVTTLVDAFVKPRVGRYIHGIKERLDPFVSGAPFYVMKSNGGVMSADEIEDAPITTILSGPAAGVLGAIAIAEAAGFDQILTLDGGGTSTDVSVVRGAEPVLTTEGTVGRFPVKVPMVDIVTVGTGGGSIAWRAPDGGLKVGPRSAGADPGPLCYSKGGVEPATTDAHLTLGRLPAALLGGEIPLDAGASKTGLESLAAAVGLTLEECASGVLEIAAWNQANAIRQMTVRRGLDVRDFAMIAFGGSGPLTACRLLDILSLRAAIIPPSPGNLSAYGLLSVDVRNDYVQTFVTRNSALAPSDLEDVFGSLTSRATESLRRSGFTDATSVYARSADLRYLGQAFEVRVSAPAGPIDQGFAAEVIGRFHDEHERLYGYCYRNDPSQVIEWVNVRVAGIGTIAKPSVPRVERGTGDVTAARSGERPVFFDGWVDATIYRRDLLRSGDVVKGPAVVEEYGSTTPIAPGYLARVDDIGNLVITKDAP